MEEKEMKYVCPECGHEIIDNSQSCECGCEDHDNRKLDHLALICLGCWIEYYF